MAIKNELAKLMTMESKLYYFIQKYPWHKEARELYSNIQDRQNRLLSTLSNAFNITITGYHEEDNVSHYDIDDALEKEFGDIIKCDSEGGRFFAYCNKNSLTMITNWLKTNFTGLDFNHYDEDDVQNPYFSNWTAAETYCKENGIEAELPAGLLKNPNIKRLEELDSQMKSLEKEKERIIKDLENTI